MENIIKIVKSFEDSGLLLKVFSETIQNEAKEQTGEFLSMLLDTLGVSLLGNMLSRRGINKQEMEWLELVMDLQSKKKS